MAFASPSEQGFYSIYGKIENLQILVKMPKHERDLRLQRFYEIVAEEYRPQAESILQSGLYNLEIYGNTLLLQKFLPGWRESVECLKIPITGKKVNRFLHIKRSEWLESGPPSTTEGINNMMNQTTIPRGLNVVMDEVLQLPLSVLEEGGISF